MDFFCGFMVVELGVAVVWFDFVGCRSLCLEFQENNSLGMFFVEVVVAGGCRGDVGFWVFVFIWVLEYIILLCKSIILTCCI